MIETWDNDEPDKYDNDFSISISLSKAEIERSKAGEKIKRTYIGNGKIWEQKPAFREPTQDELEKMNNTDDDDDGLPF